MKIPQWKVQNHITSAPCPSSRTNLMVCTSHKLKWCLVSSKTSVKKHVVVVWTFFIFAERGLPPSYSIFLVLHADVVAIPLIRRHAVCINRFHHFIQATSMLEIYLMMAYGFGVFFPFFKESHSDSPCTMCFLCYCWGFFALSVGIYFCPLSWVTGLEGLCSDVCLLCGALYSKRLQSGLYCCNSAVCCAVTNYTAWSR